MVIGILAILAYPDMLLPEEIQAEFFRVMSSRKPQVGKGNSLFYTLLVAGFLAWQSVHISITPQGFELKSQDVPLEILALCLVAIAIGLGINIIDTLKEVTRLVTEIAKIVNQNSRRLDSLEPEIKNLINNTNLELPDENQSSSDKNNER